MTNAAPSTVGITILNWNGITDTLECIESLRAQDYPDCRIFVLDNDSTDDSVDRLQALGDEICLIENGRNDGFAGGMNRVTAAAMDSGVGFVFLLNNDTTVAPDCISRLVESFRALDNPQTIIAPLTLRADDPSRIDHAGHLWDAEHCEFLPAHEAVGWRADEPNEVDHIVAAAVLVPANLIREHGLFDERFFLNYEETDWEFRLRRAGVRLFIEPRARILHKVSQSFTSPQKAYYLERNRLLWISKHFAGAEKRRIWFRMVLPRMAHIVTRVLTKAIAVAALWLTGQTKKRRDMQERLLRNRMAARGVISYFRGEFGPAPANLPFSRSAGFSTQYQENTANAKVKTDA